MHKKRPGFLESESRVRAPPTDGKNTPLCPRGHLNCSGHHSFLYSPEPE